jgi:hypothetical protein
MSIPPVVHFGADQPPHRKHAHITTRTKVSDVSLPGGLLEVSQNGIHQGMAQPQDFKVKSEAVIQLIAPVLRKPGRTNDEHPLGLAPRHQLTNHHSGFDGLPEADLIRHEEPPPLSRSQDEIPTSANALPDPDARRSDHNSNPRRPTS